MMQEKIEIPRKEYDQLLRDAHLLNCLRNAGVDNWDGWDFAIEEFMSQYGDE
jgi:hypothetical protein